MAERVPRFATVSPDPAEIDGTECTEIGGFDGQILPALS